MFSDVYHNTENKRQQINNFVANLVKLIRTPEDAAMLGPVVQSFLELNVKNDEHIVRLVQIAQRLATVNGKAASGADMLTEEEKSQLLRNIKDDFESVLADQDAINTNFESLK